MKHASAFLMILALLLSSSVVWGALPRTINYQGYLKNTDGTPVSVATDVTFALYTSSSGGTPLWTESRSVTPSNGVYGVELGSAVQFPAGLFANDSIWLGVTVGSDPEMIPRQQLNAVPFALRAATADSATGVGAGAVTDAGITGPISDGKLSSNVMLLNNSQTVTGLKTFNPGGSIPFAVNAAKIGMVSNLNAEMVGGKNLTDLDVRYLDPTRPKATLQQIATLRWDQVGSGGSGTYATGNLPVSIAFDGSSIWVAHANGNSVVKLNPATGVSLASPAVGNPRGVVFDGSSIWVAKYAGTPSTVAKINPATGTVTGSYTVSYYPYALAFDGSHVWYLSCTAGRVGKIDPATGAEVGSTIQVSTGTGPCGMAFDGASMWVANGTVNKIDRSTGTVSAPYAVGSNPVALAFDGSNIWVANNGSNNVSRINASTGVVSGPYPAGTNPVALAFDGGNIWVANNLAGGKVLKLRPADGYLLGSYDAGSYPNALAFDGANIWVSNGTSNNVTKLANVGMQVGPQTVGTSQLMVNAVTTGLMADGSVTTAKLANGAVATAQIADGSITTGKLADSSVTTAKLNIDGNLNMHDKDVSFRGDAFHGLGWYGSGKLFAGQNLNGPALYGNGGGALGTNSDTQKIALSWDQNGNVTAANNLTIVNSLWLNNTAQIYMQDRGLYLRNDTNHGLGWFGTGKTFSNTELDGPALYGYAGGALGTTNGGEKIALKWDSNSNVTVPAKLSAGPGLTATPIAYGVFNANGSKSSGSANFSCIWDSVNSWYECTISGEEYHFSTNITNVTALDGYSPIICTTASVAGNLIVSLFNTSGNRIQHMFGVTVYKP